MSSKLPFNSTLHVMLMCGNTPNELLHCPTHYENIAGYYNFSEKYRWMVTLHCSICQISWNVCTDVGCFIRTRIITEGQIKKHNGRPCHRFYKKRKIVMQEVPHVAISTEKSCLPDFPLAAASTEKKDLSGDPQAATNLEKTGLQVDIYTAEKSLITVEPQREDSCTKAEVIACDSASNIDHIQENIQDCPETLLHNGIEEDYIIYGDIDEIEVHHKPAQLGVSISERSKIFFSHHRNGQGLSYLAGLSHFGLRCLFSDIPKDNVNVYLKYAALLRRLGAKDRTALGELIHSFEELLISRTAGPKINPNEWQILKFPVNEKGFKKSFFESDQSLYMNYPVPEINISKDGDAYVLLSDVITHYLELGGAMYHPCSKKSTYPQKSIIDSLRCQEWITKLNRRKQSLQESMPTEHDDFYLLLVTDWSDDFEPNYGSHNKGSVYMKTITMVKPGDSPESVLHTFPLVVGKKDNNHDSVDKIISDDIKMMQTNCELWKYFSNIHKRNIQIYPVLIASLQDQPARRSYCALSNGNGKYAARWGYACDWGSLSKILPMCSTCLVRMENANDCNESQWNYQFCALCTQWAFRLDHNLLRHQPPIDYPIDVDYLVPRKLNFEELRLVVETTHDNMVKRVWSAKASKSYLKTWALSIATINDIVDRADNCSIWSELSDENNEDDTYLRRVQQDRDDHPSNYIKWAPPCSWSREHGIDEFTNAIMHLISGVSKTTAISAMNWTERKYSIDEFTKRAQQMVNAISTLGLGWCRLPPKFGGKFVGSLSENNINMGRILPWIFSVIPAIEVIPVVVFPSTPQKKWLKKDNETWLKIRGLTHKGTADQLKERVSLYMLQRIVPPTLSESVGDNLIPMKAIHALHRLQSLIFSECIMDHHFVTRVEVRVRLFLQYYSCLDSDLAHNENEIIIDAGAANDTQNQVVTQNEYVNNGRKNHQKNSSKRSRKHTPSWVSSYNFLSLLNLGDEITNLGPPRGHYEGSFKGEKIVSKMKPLISGGLVGNWHENALRRYWMEYVDGAINGESFFKKTSSFENVTDKGKMLKIYSDLAEVYISIGRGMPISACIDQQRQRYIAVKCGASTATSQLFPIFLGDDTINYCGMKYASLTLNHNDYNDVKEYKTVSIDDYILLLPMIHDAPVDDKLADCVMFTEISHKWRDFMTATSVKDYRKTNLA